MRRRTLLAAPLLAGTGALAACDERSAADPLEAPTAAPAARSAAVPALRALAPFPVGTEVLTSDLDSAVGELAARQFSQVTAGFEMKMEVVLRPDGSRNFGPGDRIAAWARANRQRLHGHCLVWYAQDAAAFRALEGRPREFTAAYDRYIVELMRRWPAAGWDVVNEPIDDAEGALRPSLWASVLGPEAYMVRAFQQARAADPRALLILNEYGLETKPAKRLAFLKLVERLLKLGAPITGLGTQCHIDVDLPAGAGAAMMADLARLDLPIHVSELDVSLKPRALTLRSRAATMERQAARYAELLDAFAKLPARQRYAFTVWGVRDDSSWLNSPGEYAGRDAPLLFDAQGAPKDAFWALARRLGG